MENLQKFIMGIVGIAVLITVGLLVLDSLGESIADDISATTYQNATLTWTNNTAVGYLNASCITETGTCVRLWNNSDEIASDNYTCTTSALTFLNGGHYYSINSETNTSLLTYTCKVATDSYTANTSIIEKIATVPTWIGILIVVALAMIVLSYFYRK